MTILMFDTQYSMRNRIAELEQQLAEAKAYNKHLEMENSALACELAIATDYIERLEEPK
jgi:hypothetical protein